MKATIQRVSKASVAVNNAIVSSIDNGLVALIGISSDDTDADLDYIARKLLNIRIWPSTASSGGDQKAWDTSVKDNGYEILCVSQFTLCGRLKGNKPDFSKAMPPLQAKAMYEKLLDRLKKEYDADKIKDGVFGALMEVSIQNSGPVTITLDSSKD
ncbi:D-aminoacyl-tRNA deacylase 1 [Picochlorum sp. SENEW3]|nr:D-aminoacyl-tRNA deacylase 1 [Picochlorum sp. SENEW3]